MGVNGNFNIRMASQVSQVMIISIDKRYRLLTLPILILLTTFGFGQAQATSRPAVARIELSFKRDIREIDPFRGIGPWSTAPTFTGAAGQDTVEIRAEGVDASGRPFRISPGWATSDTEVATVSPSNGDDVKLTVHKEGTSNLRITDQGASKDLVISAKKTGAFLIFQIAPPAPPKPNGPVAGGMNPALKGQKEQLSYAAGMRLAKTLRAQSVDVDPDLVSQAMKDVLAGRSTLMSDDQEQVALMGVETQLNFTAASVERRKIVEKNKAEAEAFLAENKKRDGIFALPSGLQYKVIKAGDGRKPTGVDVAVCQYRGTLIDGTVFDDSRKRKDGGPVSFPLKTVIKGWQEALRLMPAGSKWQIFIPPDLAYGERGVPQAKIPPNAALVFEVELLSVRGPSNPSSPPGDSAQKTALSPEQLEALKKAIQERVQENESETKSEKNQ